MTPVGFPHSEIHESKAVSASSWLIAAGRVLHRLSVPRHPPRAHSILVFSIKNLILYGRTCFKKQMRSQMFVLLIKHFKTFKKVSDLLFRWFVFGCISCAIEKYIH